MRSPVKIILLLVLIWALPFMAGAQFIFFTNNGSITITGGSVTNGTVQIPGTLNGRTVTTLGTNAFYNNLDLTNLFLPASVVNIQDGAFGGCYNLAGIAFSGNLTNISRSAFYGCAVTNLTLPGRIISIGSSAFQSCPNLTTVTISSNVTSIGTYAFASCTSLTNIVVDSKNARYGSTNGVLFNQKKTALLLYPSGKSGSYDVPGGVTTIAKGVFSFCPKLTGLTIPTGVTNVADASLLNLSGLIFPQPGPYGQFNGQAVFADCANLTNITVDPLNANYSSVDGVLIDKLKGRILQCPQAKGGTFIVPTNVTRLGTNCFANCTQLSQVTITNTVVRIEDGAFGGCSGLTSVTIPGSVIRLGAQAFAYCSRITNFTLTTNLAIIGDSAFQGCQSLHNLIIPRTVTNLTGSAFYSAGFQLLPFIFSQPYGLTNITVDAANPSYSSVRGMLFDKLQTHLIICPYGKTDSFDLPGTVTNIDELAFASCFFLTNFTLPPAVVALGTNAFDDCFRLVHITLPAGLKRMDAGAFNGCEDLSDIVIPAGVTKIGDYSFDQCGSLASVTFSGNITNIGYSAFSYCYNLTNITLPASLTTIGFSAFSDCLGLTSINIPAGVTNIGDGVFSACYSLTNIDVNVLNPAYSGVAGVLFDKSQKQIIEYPPGKIGDGHYSIPGGVTNIEANAFDSCTGLTSVIIPKSVIGIGFGAFVGCSDLTGIYFRGNAPGLSAFTYADFLSGFGVIPATVYYLPGATGWGTNYGGFATAVWPPAPQTADTSFGIHTNRFGFNVVWSTGQKVVVEASTNITGGIWQPIQTNTLVTNSWYFSDSQWTNYPGRYYRIRSP